MKPPRAAIPTSLLALLVACSSSPSTPTADVPDLRGTWRGPGQSWNWSEDYISTPGLHGIGGCEGELVIDVQSGSSFQGGYAIGCAGSLASGRVQGDVEADGKVRVRLAPEEGWDPGRGPRAAQWRLCSSDAEPGVFEGSLDQGSLELQHFEPLTCPTGPVIVTARFRGSRRPSS